MVEGFFSAQSRGVMGDTDRTEFSFNYAFSDDELLELLERNPRVGMMCQWMVQQALKDGILFAQPTMDVPSVDIEGKSMMAKMSTEERLQQIQFMAKIERAMMFARLHGASMVMMLDKSGRLNETATENGNQYVDFEVYHRFAGKNGWKVKATDDQGKPTIFTLYIMTEKMTESLSFDVNADRCVIFKNPKIGQRWDGTPSSKKIAHVAQLEELIIKLAGKFALDRASSFLHAENVPNETAAAAIETELDKIPLKYLSTGPGIGVEPKSFQSSGSGADFEVITTILKKYMANAMQVSQSLMDGAAEGAGGSNTLSSSQTNTLVSYSTIAEIQQHFQPFIEDVLKKLGFDDPNIEFTKPEPINPEGEEKDGGKTTNNPTKNGK